MNTNNLLFRPFLRLLQGWTWVFKLLLLSLYIFGQGCTSNPFSSGNGDTKDKHVLTGSVRLSDGVQANDIYIWMSKVQLSAKTNSAGDFLLQIPRTDAFAGYNDTCKVYFYMGNYAFAVRDVYIRNGEFAFGELSISDDGKLKEIITLKKILNITATVEPEIIGASQGGFLDLDVRVTAYEVAVTVQTYQTRDSSFASIIFLPDNSDPSQAILLDISGADLTSRTVFNFINWTSRMPLAQNALNPGVYQIIPYIQVIQKNLPQELITSLGQNAHKFSTDYLKIPFKRETGQITVQ